MEPALNKVLCTLPLDGTPYGNENRLLASYKETITTCRRAWYDDFSLLASFKSASENTKAAKGTKERIFRKERRLGSTDRTGTHLWFGLPDSQEGHKGPIKRKTYFSLGGSPRVEIADVWRCERVATSLNRAVSGDTFPIVSSLDKPVGPSVSLYQSSELVYAPTTGRKNVQMDQRWDRGRFAPRTALNVKNGRKH
ncbi:hypothetical protein NQ318_014189 [Aromia moschata]|uniref:Uncharacterized protein n=1 Tax=Aromia moschata TaxID=1265417 RepID=A0AAV8Y801_9CUCU|nr:hypothetical protein NQ318_014189 [Aromia moschata]